MKVPRDFGGRELASRLSQFGYQITRQTGSHIRLASTFMGAEHHITIPAHTPLKIGTLSGIVREIADYMGMDKREIMSRIME